jgi:hypothetical protein
MTGRNSAVECVTRITVVAPVRTVPDQRRCVVARSGLNANADTKSRTLPSCLPVRAISAFQPAKISSSSAPARPLAIRRMHDQRGPSTRARKHRTKTSTWVQMMAKSRKVISKKRGRPATGRNPVFAIRLPVELTAAIEKWAARNETASWSDTIRRLVEVGLSGSQPMKRRSPRTH